MGRLYGNGFGKRPLSGPLWFFAYEAWRRDWLDALALTEDPLYEFFQQMEQAGISFFNPNALPSALEGKDEDEWEDMDAIEDVAGEYETDDQFARDMEEF
jgi:hypothetical protein